MTDFGTFGAMKKYVVLAFTVVAVCFLHSFFLSAGGIGADSLSYFGIAADLPHPETNLFPLGFPVLLRIFHLVFQDYFWASKFLNLFLMSAVLIFSYFRKFYFRESVLLFTGKTLFMIFTGVLSESLFIVLMYFLLYFFHERFKEKISSRKFLCWNSVLMVAMLATRYSGLYVWLGILVWFIFVIFKNEQKKLRKDFLLFLLFSGAGILMYLMLNQIYFGSFTGENLRGKPAKILPVDIFRNFMGVANVVNPFIGIKPASNSWVSLGFQFLLMIFDGALLYYMFKIFKSKRGSSDKDFHALLWSVAFVYTLMLFISGFFQQIEELNMRMLAAANFCIFFSFLIVYFKNLRNDRVIFGLGVFFLIFMSLYNIKIPDNYLANKKEIENQLPKFSNKKILFNDETDIIAESEYKIPFSDRKIKYSHTNRQPGAVKQNVAGTVNPKIKWVKTDSALNKSNILYTSQLHLRKKH